MALVCACMIQRGVGSKRNGRAKHVSQHDHNHDMTLLDLITCSESVPLVDTCNESVMQILRLVDHTPTQ